MNTGMVPYVNVTIVDERMTSAIPDVRIIKPLFKRLRNNDITHRITAIMLNGNSLVIR